MRICHVNLASGYHGGENQTLQLIKQQVKLGYDLTVITNPKSPLTERVKELGCRVITAKHYIHAHKKSYTEHCELIHVHEGRAIYWALIQNLLFKVPYIITRRIDNKFKDKHLSNLAYRKASALIGLSTEIVRNIKDAHPHASIHKIPSSPVTYDVDVQELKKLQDQFESKFVIIHAANMLSHKGFDVTISAAKLLENQLPEIHFCLLGDGSQKAELEKQASGLSNVTFTGKQKSMGPWFALAQLQVHPSYTEGLGSVILEGMGAGLAVIGTKTGGIPDIIQDRENGLLVQPGDGQALAEAIHQLYQDPELRASIVSRAKETLKQFDISYTATLYNDIYQEVKQ